MAITLLQIAQATMSTLKQGVIEHLVETSPLLSRLPFVEVPTLRYEWAIRRQLPKTGFRAINSSYVASSSVYDRGRIDLKILGGEVRIDRSFVDLPDVAQQRFYATELQAVVRSASLSFKRAVVKGNSVNPAEFDGLQKWFDEGILTETVDVSATGSNFAALGAAATLNKINEALSKCIVVPDVILANRAVINQLASLALASAGNEAFASYFRMQKFDIGLINGQERQISVGLIYDIPVIPMDTDAEGNEILSFTEPSPNGANNDCTSMYFCCLGENYMVGLQQSSEGPRVFEYSTESGHRAIAVDWPTAIAVEHPRAVVRLRGIRP